MGVVEGVGSGFLCLGLGFGSRLVGGLFLGYGFLGGRLLGGLGGLGGDGLGTDALGFGSGLFGFDLGLLGLLCFLEFDAEGFLGRSLSRCDFLFDGVGGDGIAVVLHVLTPVCGLWYGVFHLRGCTISH